MSTAQTVLRLPCPFRGKVAARHRLDVKCNGQHSRAIDASCDAPKSGNLGMVSCRRELLLAATAVASAAVLPGGSATAAVQGFTPMSALEGKDYGKPRMSDSNFVSTASGLQYNDIRVGDGKTAGKGSNVVVDWTGVTIGYYGRPFEAKNKTKGSAFTDDNKEYYRFQLGNDTVIPAWEEGLVGMREGGIRRLIVPEELGYPNGNWDIAGPKPTTFSGERALGFVLQNQGFVDKTLLFDISLIRIDE